MKTFHVAAMFTALLCALMAYACGDDGTDDANPSGSTCAVLSSVHATSSDRVSGNAEQGPMSSYSFDASSDSTLTVTPPNTDNPCQLEMASRMQGACAICEQSGDAPCLEAMERLFDLTQTPIASCAVCGDNICQVGEDECEIDCGSSCGDDICSGDEDEDSCPADCGETCGDGVCDGDESPQTCPQDCTSQSTCGNAICEDTESTITCPEDCAECGDRICNDTLESPNICAIDCDICGDGMRGRSEVCDEAQADPDNEDPLQRKIFCAEDCQ